MTKRNLSTRVGWQRITTVSTKQSLYGLSKRDGKRVRLSVRIGRHAILKLTRPWRYAFDKSVFEQLTKLINAQPYDVANFSNGIHSDSAPATRKPGSG